MFLRPGAPRPRAQKPFPPGGRGASPLASPCFFVLGHRVPEHSSLSRPAGVVPHRSLTIVSSSWGTTSPEHRRKVMHEQTKSDARKPPTRLRASLFPYYIFKRKELTTNTTRPPFVVNSNHLPVPLAPTCIRHHKKMTTDSCIRKVCRQSSFFFIFLL